MIHGRNLILAIGGAPIAGARGCSVDRDTDTIEVCSPTDGAARTYIPGATGWSASANGLYADEEKAILLREVYRRREKVQVQYTTGFCKESGVGIITKLQETGEVNGLAKFSISIQGSGSMIDNKTSVDLGTLSSANADDVIIVEDGDAWTTEQNQDGAVVVQLTYGKNYFIENKGAYPIAVVRASGASADTIAGILESGDPSAVIENTVMKIGSGEMRVVKKSTSQLFVIVDNQDEYKTNCALSVYS